MPVSPTYPGVYIDELPAAVRTVAGVPTSITAFVGAAARGPLNTPRRIYNYGEYERIFGGLYAASDMSYAVAQYFANGGGVAEVVRVGGYTATDPKDGCATISCPTTSTTTSTTTSADTLELRAASPGVWGAKLAVYIDLDTAVKPSTTLYNLVVKDTGTGFEERYRNISTSKSSPDWIEKRIGGSRLIAYVSGGEKQPKAKPEPAPNAQPDPYAPSAGTAKDIAPTVTDFTGSEALKTGIYALLKTDIFNLLCLPGVPDAVAPAAELCLKRRAILIMDPPTGWTTVQNAVDIAPPSLGDGARNAVVYYPRIILPDPLQGNNTRPFPPCGAVAGVIARTDGARGIWKAPAGTDAGLAGVYDLEVVLTDGENGQLNPLGVNCLRRFPVIGPVVWGARTMRGADLLADQWKYLPVRRTALYIEESLFRGTQWVVFEPNDEPLWSSVRLSVGAFMNGMFRAGAFQGSKPSEAYIVKCDRENNPQEDIDRGILNILVGFAPLKPAEFVIIHIQQLAGQSAA